MLPASNWSDVLKSDLDKLEISIESLKVERYRLKLQSDAIYNKLRTMPQVAKEFSELDRDYQVTKAHYHEIQEKLMTAQVSQGMEEGQLGESFQIIEPAFLPEEPHKPNRFAIMLIPS